MLTDLLQKIKSFFKENQRDLYLASLVFLVSMASFGLGRLSVIWPEKQPIRIDEAVRIDKIDEAATISNSTKRGDPSSPTISPVQDNYVASRNGSAYHLPDCPGAKQIKEENKIWFTTTEEARAAGYKPAGNCPEL